MLSIEVNAGTYALLFTLVAAQSCVLLWATGTVAGLGVRSGRLLGASFLGAAYDVAADLAGMGVYTVPARLGWLFGWQGVVAVSLAALGLAFWPVPARRVWRLVGYYYFLAALGGGSAYMLQNLAAPGWVPPLVATGVILIAGEAGWGIVQHWLWERLVFLALTVSLDGRSVTVPAMVDTGNELRDPLTGEPVLILGGHLAGRLLGEAAAAAVAVGADDAVAGAASLAEIGLGHRIRLIPYTTVGRQGGLLLALRPDRVTFVLGTEPVEAGPVFIAFHREPLSADGAYEALVHPALLRRARPAPADCEPLKLGWTEARRQSAAK